GGKPAAADPEPGPGPRPSPEAELVHYVLVTESEMINRLGDTVGTVTLWKVAEGEKPAKLATLLDEKGNARAGSVSVRGGVVYAFANGDMASTLWKVTAEGEAREIASFEGQANGIIESGGVRYILNQVSWHPNYAARVWKLTAEDEVSELATLNGEVTAAASGGVLYVLGGKRKEDGSPDVTTVWKITAEGKVRSQIIPSSIRSQITASGGDLYVLGQEWKDGQWDNINAKMWKITAKGKVSELAVLDDFNHSYVFPAAADTLYVVGGKGSIGLYNNGIGVITVWKVTTKGEAAELASLTSETGSLHVYAHKLNEGILYFAGHEQAGNKDTAKVWKVTSEGNAGEFATLVNTRRSSFAMNLTLGEGILYVAGNETTARGGIAKVWKVTPEGEVSELASLTDGRRGGIAESIVSVWE
ncbi:MAG: hypothetical protein LBG84_03420, partial [Treponema sp.]|nr:hypothetical protein [Treponema sp.]